MSETAIYTGKDWPALTGQDVEVLERIGARALYVAEDGQRRWCFEHELKAKIDQSGLAQSIIPRGRTDEVA